MLLAIEFVASVIGCALTTWFLLRRQQAAHKAVLTRIHDSQKNMAERIIAISHDAGFEAGFRMAKYYPERPITFYLKRATDEPGTQQYFELSDEEL